MGNRTNSGFTLVELMITLVVLAILLALAAPNMRELILGNRLSTQTNNLVATLQFARSEAIKRAAPIRVDPLPPADEDETDWGVEGWRVWVDYNNDGTLDDTGTPRDLELRAVQKASSGAINVNISPLIYQPNGGTSTDFFVARVCNSELRATDNQREVQVFVSGLVQTRASSNPTCS